MSTLTKDLVNQQEVQEKEEEEEVPLSLEIGPETNPLFSFKKQFNSIFLNARQLSKTTIKILLLLLMCFIFINDFIQIIHPRGTDSPNQLLTQQIIQYFLKNPYIQDEPQQQHRVQEGSGWASTSSSTTTTRMSSGSEQPNE